MRKSQSISEVIIGLNNSKSIPGSQHRNGVLSCSANQMGVTLPLGQSAERK